MDERTALSPQVRGLCRRLAAATTAVLAQAAKPECCILAARVLGLAAEAVGIPSKLYPCTAMVCNAAAKEWWITHGGRWPEESEQGDWDAAGGFILAIGGGKERPGWWPYHLPCVLAGVYLTDPSLPLSCTRERHNLTPPSYHALTSEGLVESVGHFVSSGPWGLVVYTHARNAPSWTDAPDWTGHARARHLSRRVLRLVQSVDAWGPMDSGT